MKVVAPKSFTYKAGNRAVLLLHGFTGSTTDVRKLGRYLQKSGYTCHAPLYQGHGVGPEQLIKTGPDDWWQDVLDGYDFLKSEGFDEIAVAGVSLGGVFSLKLATEMPVKGIVSMCAPMQTKSIEDLTKRVNDYAQGYKKIEGKNYEQIEVELENIKQHPIPSLKDIQRVIVDMSEKLKIITAPTFVLQGKLDDDLYIESADYIYNHVNTDDKKLKWYEHSGHIITLGTERDQIFEDIDRFLESLNWQKL